MPNKYTSKVTQDGVELTWLGENNDPIDSSAQAAKFYVKSVDALQRFRNDDPRSEPKLRATVNTLKRWLAIAISLTALWATYHLGKGDLGSYFDKAEDSSLD